MGVVQGQAEVLPLVRKSRPCILCQFFRDMVAPAITLESPFPPPLVFEAVDGIRLTEQGGQLDLCPTCAQLLQLWMRANIATRRQMEELAGGGPKPPSRIILPGREGGQPLQPGS